MFRNNHTRSNNFNFKYSTYIYIDVSYFFFTTDDSIPLVIHPRSYSHQEQSLSATSPLVYNHAGNNIVLSIAYMCAGVCACVCVCDY